MKAQKVITVRSSINIDVTGVTLLTTKEAKSLSKDILCASCNWWLRSPGLIDLYAACVFGEDGYVYGIGSDVRKEFGVRPALKINPESSELDVGDKFLLFGYAWTVITKNKALCDEVIEKSPFRRDWLSATANKYAMSDIRRFLNKWFKKVTSEIS